MPLPHLGTDIVHLPRILRLLTRPGYLARFTTRILTDRERADFRTRFAVPPMRDLTEKQKQQDHDLRGPVSRDMAAWLAGRFAAKEAARKAVPSGAGSLSWKDVCVVVPRPESAGGERGDGKSRKPEIEVLGKSKETAGMEARVSISHDADYVVATVLVGEG